MVVASVALSGIYPFAGFFSKDKILEVAFSGNHYILWFVLWVTAGLTAFYSFRLVMYVFFGKEEYKNFGLHPHETYKFVILALSPLAILAVVAGFFEEQFIHIVSYVLPDFVFNIAHTTEIVLIGITSFVALFGILFAITKYKMGGFSKSLEDTKIYKLLYNQYYIPEFYDKYVTKPYFKIADFLWKEIDIKIVDATVDLVAEILVVLGKVSSYFFNSGNLSKMLRIMAGGVIFFAILAILFTIPKGV
jgi:NADH-quinone oxidoreductase subunit L